MSGVGCVCVYIHRPRKSKIRYVTFLPSLLYYLSKDFFFFFFEMGVFLGIYVSYSFFVYSYSYLLLPLDLVMSFTAFSYLGYGILGGRGERRREGGGEMSGTEVDTQSLRHALVIP